MTLTAFKRAQQSPQHKGSPCSRQRRRWRAGLVFLAVLPSVACSQRNAISSANTNTSQPNSGNSEEAVHFVSKGFTLAGTLILPRGTQPLPAVVLFHGSGPQTRDLPTARWFAEQGVAALAYDKRGVGESDGNFQAIPFMELCNDGLAGVAYLNSRKEIDAKRIGVWGLSQGGWLGPLAASRSAQVAFVIAVSGPGVSPGEQMIVYYANELQDRGLSESDVRAASNLRREIWSYKETGQGYDKTKADLETARTKKWFKQAKAQQDDSFARLPTPAELRNVAGRSAIWFQQEAVYDSVPALHALHVPALFLFGDHDRLLPVEKSVGVIQDVLAKHEQHDFTIRVFPHADHGMRLATGDARGELDPEYLQTMREWLNSRVLK